MSQDPIGDGANWYAYVDDNPLTSVDPTGLASKANLDCKEKCRRAYRNWRIFTYVYHGLVLVNGTYTAFTSFGTLVPVIYTLTMANYIKITIKHKVMLQTCLDKCP